MTCFYIVRHGNTFSSGEKPTRIGSRTDLPLTKVGREQSERLGKYFFEKGMIFTAVFSSPLCRATETADRICKFQPCVKNLQTLDILTEIDHGPDENCVEEDVVARVGVEAIRSWDMDAKPPPDWIINADDRIAGWLQFYSKQTKKRPNDAILLVTSNGAARFALKSIESFLTGVESIGSLKLSTGAYGCLEFRSDDEASIVNWNVRP